MCKITLGSVGITADDFFSEGTNSALLTNINCSGSESVILDCSHDDNRGHFCHTAGVVCQGTFLSNCCEKL